MKKILTLIVSTLLLFGSYSAKADEGMWIPALLTDNYAEMQRLGLTLTPEQIYSINNSSMKDAIVRLGRGFCTGEVISSQGLILTNHHCGYSAIQALSSTTANHLKNGFWAKDHSEEKPAGFSISFLVRIDDITEQVLAGVTDNMTYEQRAEKVNANSSDIRKNLSNEGEYDVDLKEMFSGNKYFAYIYQTFQDVRLVGTPPESVGKYGGDTDNWMWPRHTGDFSMFRVYANKENKPAPYSAENVPYSPKHHLPVSLKGVEQGDFAMIWGFPGSTDRYLTSYGVKLATEKDQPARVKLRRSKLDIYEKYQSQSDAVDLMYAAKHAQVSNYWKYFIGQTRGLKKLGVYDKKKAEEQAFVDWVNAGDAARKAKYGDVMRLYEEAYKVMEESTLAETYFTEGIAGIEFLRYGFNYARLKSTMDAIASGKYEDGMDNTMATIHSQAKLYMDNSMAEANRQQAFATLKALLNDAALNSAAFDSKESMSIVRIKIAENLDKAKANLVTTRDRILTSLNASVDNAFKDYFQPIDREVAVSMFSYYLSDLAPDKRPAEFNTLLQKYNGDINSMVDAVFEKSFLVDIDRTKAFLAKPKFGKLKRDPGVMLSEMFLNFYLTSIQEMYGDSREKRETADRLYKSALFQMHPDKKYAPDANSSMRFTYGQVLQYSPGDAMLYKHFTTMQGVLEKYQAGDDEFDLPANFLEKARAKDFGRYAKPGEDLRVCFLSNNDITGGNSGSPVINGNGELIGLAFDGNWEAMSGDIAFETELQRTISVDIRYVLWCIDKLAGAGHIVDEMTLVQ